MYPLLISMEAARMNVSDTVLGIEFGTTRIKAVLLDREHRVIASGSHLWENRQVDGLWTYPMEEIDGGLQACYAALKRDVAEKYGVELTTVGAIGVSAMMHGYLPFDSGDRQLAEFRTWRNTVTGQAAAALTELFGFNIPQRWCIAHLYQAILNGEPHVKDIAHLTTLAGYVHWRLTGEKRVGLGEASGIFPLAFGTADYDPKMLGQFDRLIADRGFGWKIRELLPDPVPIGGNGGYLTEAGACYLDPTGTLKSGIPLAPCEGDADTGMVATNSVRAGTGNVSAGTSVFAMLVTDHPLGVHREVDMVVTPAGLPVAMVHCSNCTSDINAWAGLFAEFADAIGAPQEMGELYGLLFRKAMEGEPDGGGLTSYNYFSGECIMDLAQGRPVFVRQPDRPLTLANFMRTHLLSALATLKIGLDRLRAEEEIKLGRVCAHGGFFKTPGVGQKLLSAVMDTPVLVMDTAGEGGPYGMALLCAYMLWHDAGESLEDYLDHKVFEHASVCALTADEETRRGCQEFIRRYKQGFELERAAVRLV